MSNDDAPKLTVVQLGSGCGIDSHLFYMLMILVLFSLWILVIIFIFLVRTCLSHSIRKVLTPLVHSLCHTKEFVSDDNRLILQKGDSTLNYHSTSSRIGFFDIQG